jgi:4-amino-4-deoxy-L-arabinose transferase-like glycosyltransferase
MKKDWQNILLLLLLLLGFGLRMIDLTDPPLDFHPTRQFRGALIARSIYYDMLPRADTHKQALAAEMRAGFPEFEPPVLETVTALGYLLAGGEQLWIARLIVSLVWVIGGWGLFLLLRRLTSPATALVAVAYYLFLPFAVYASRSFQPDPVMTVLLIFCAYAALRWVESQGWKWALITALFAVFAVMAKVVAAYMIGGLMIAIVLHRGLKRSLRDPQVWTMAGLMFLLPGLYYFLSIGESSSNYFQNWMVALMPLVLTKAFYVGWLHRLDSFNRLALLAALVGWLVFSKGLGRWMLTGFWAGYLVYAFTLPHQTMTHNYYHIQLTPVIAWSLACGAAWFFQQLDARWKRVSSVALAALMLASLYPAAVAAQTLIKEDHRHEPVYWEYIGEQIPEDGKTTIGLVQQYGHLLMYYGWREIALWPPTGELYLAELRGNPNVKDFQTFFAQKTEEMDYFLITAFNQFERQNELYKYLNQNYPILSEGQGFVIFDLR